jgi:tellurite resistance protein TerC
LGVTTRFFVKRDGRTLATPLFVALLFVEMTDLIFAVDSIPAILAISQDAFIVYTSNVFAILGLRALYFALAGIVEMFHYLHYGLAAVLVFVGTKMLMADFYKMPIGVSLGVIATILAVSVAASLWRPEPKEAPAPGASAAPKVYGVQPHVEGHCGQRQSERRPQGPQNV